MAFTKEVIIKNDATYSLNPNIKKYAIMDSGFFQNENSGAWLYTAMLEPTKGMSESIKLKVTINADLNGLMMNIVNPKENMNIEIIPFSDSMMKEQYEFIINFLVDKEILLRKLD